ncbi:unnamed protein product [Symbiodinium sp. KB8]|nr:unnamed protein product [Symbiodinium sp. KB8]
MSAVSARSVKGCMERAMQAAYRQKPKPWQEDAICKTVAAWKDRQVFLFDHPRGSGKTKEMACMALVAFKYKDVQCVVVVSDRLDLASQTAKEMKDFFSHYPTRNGSKEKVPQVKQITAAWELEAEWEELAKGERLVLCVTLQCFPHVKEGKQLPECYQERTIVLADEVHRSHADKDPTIWFFIKSSQLASSGRHPPFFDRLYMQVMDRQQARQSESPVTEGGMRLLLSFRQLCCTAAALLVVGCTVVGLYSTVPIVSENTTVQQLLFVLAFVTMLVGCLAWMAFLRCYVLKQSPWSTEELRDIRPVQDHLWASVRFGDLEKATPAVCSRLRDLMWAHPGYRHLAQVVTLSDAQILSMWAKNRRTAASQGTWTHALCECLLNGGSVPVNSAEICTFFKFLRVFQSEGWVIHRTEWTVYAEAEDLAGSIDAVAQRGSNICLLDWKRTKQLASKDCSFGRRLHFPLEDTQDSVMWHYRIQLNIYAWILRQFYDVTATDLRIVCLHPDNGFEPLVIPVPIMSDGSMVTPATTGLQ